MENEKKLIIVWSESNRDDHKAKHGVDFLDASFMFRKDTLTGPAKHSDDGEARMQSLGEVEGVWYRVIHTIKEDHATIKITIISAFSLSKNGRSYERYKREILASLGGDEEEG